MQIKRRVKAKSELVKIIEQPTEEDKELTGDNSLPELHMVSDGEDENLLDQETK